MSLILYFFLTNLAINLPFVYLICVIRHNAVGITGYLCNSTDDIIQDRSVMNMIDIELNTGSLEEINQSYFQNILKLKHLEIVSSARNVRPNTFGGLPYLSLLALQNNHLPRIRRGIFENLPITYLDLLRNGIETIEECAFNNNTNLETLCLTHNNLQIIDYGVFNGLFVELLALSYNKIYTIAPHAFYNMSRLKVLHLDHNLLHKFVPQALLNHGAQLRILWLNNNVFKQIDRKLVKGVYKLRILNLASNQISKIVAYTFKNLKQLDSLILSRNELEELEADIFPAVGTSHLKMLYINHNRLSYLTTNLLNRLTGLISVQIFGNPWQCPCLDLIFRWLHDFKIKPGCDDGYLNGSTPVCIERDEKPNICCYVSDLTYFAKFQEAISKVPKGRCLL